MNDKDRRPLLVGVDGTTLKSERSGIGFYTEHLVAGLLALDGEYQYIVFSNSKVSCDWIPAAWVHMGQGFPIRGIWMQAILPLLLRQARVDVCHYTNYLAPLLSRCPAIVTIHDMSVTLLPRHSPLKKRLLLRLLIPLVARKAEAIITVSDASRQDIIRVLGVPEQKVHRIYEGVSQTFRPVEDEEEVRRVAERYGLRGRYFIAVGTVEPRKNLVRLARAFSTFLDRTRSDVQLLVVGGRGWRSGPILGEMKGLLGEALVWPGYAPSADLPCLYTGAMALVYPSLYEGFGLPLLEAMACGTPVISSNASSLREVGGEAALYVAPEDAEEIARAMIRILDEPGLREALRKKGLERAPRFSWEQAALQTRRLYEEVGNARATHRRNPTGGRRAPEELRAGSSAHVGEGIGPAPDPEAFAAIKTAVYAGLFEYPLTVEEMHRGFFDVAVSREEMAEAIRRSKLIQTIERGDRAFLVLDGLEHTVDLRLEREERSKAFLARMKKPLAWLCGIPFVRMIALSGGSAHSYGTDLDLFVIAAPRRVWTVTLASVLVSKALGLRRTICVNYLLDEDALEVRARDFFTAHQVVTAKPVHGLEVYESFVGANRWVREHFPNFRPVSEETPVRIRAGGLKDTIERLTERWWDGVEGVIRTGYGRYLRWKLAPFDPFSDVALTPHRLQLNVIDHKEAVAKRFRRELTRSIQAAGLGCGEGRGGPRVSGGASE